MKNTKNISFNKKYQDDFTPAVAVLFCAMLGLVCGLVYTAQKYQDKTIAPKTESVQPKENKIVNMQNTLKITNFMKQR
jgi:hypothetical protein